MLCHHHPPPLSYVHTYNNVLSRQGTLVVVVVVVLVAGVYSLLNYDGDVEIAQ